MQLRHINIRALIAEAGGDPWAIEHSLHAGRPAQIAELAEAFHAAGRCTAEANAAFEEARRRFEASWNRENGEHPINDSAEVQRVTAALGVQSLQLPKIGVDLENIAADLAEAQRAAAGRIATLESQLQRIDDQLDQALELEHDPRLAAAERSELDALITCLEQDAIDDTASALGQLQSIRAGYSDHLQQSLAMLRADGYDGAGLQGLDAPQSPVKPEEPIQIPPPGTGAPEVHRWWTSLTSEERQRLIAEHPEQIGNLNGVPVSARSDANIAVMTRDLNRVRDIATRYRTSVDDVLGDPAKYGLSAGDITRYRNADETKKGLDHNARNDPRNPSPVYLFAYDPMAFGGKGRAAIAIGNPDTAKHTAVIVPGTSSSVKGGWLHDNHDDALNLFNQAKAADPNNPTAVIAWMGYDGPERLHRPAYRHSDAGPNRWCGTGRGRQRFVGNASRRRPECHRVGPLVRLDHRGRRVRLGRHACQRCGATGLPGNRPGPQRRELSPGRRPGVCGCGLYGSDQHARAARQPQPVCEPWQPCGSAARFSRRPGHRPRRRRIRFGEVSR